jgi:hypothetical protein
MSSLPPRQADLTDAARAEALEFERWVAELLALHRPSEKKPWWESSAVISPIVALVTLLLTSGLGYCTQAAQKDRDVALGRHELVLSKERDAMTGLNDLLSTLLYTNGERLKLANGTYERLPVSMRAAVLDETNAADARWLREQYARDLDVHLYFAGNRTIAASWDSTRAAMRRYATCVETAYLAATKVTAPMDACAAEGTVAASRLTEFRAAMITQYNEDFARPMLRGARAATVRGRTN